MGGNDICRFPIAELHKENVLPSCPNCAMPSAAGFQQDWQLWFQEKQQAEVIKAAPGNTVLWLSGGVNSLGPWVQSEHFKLLLAKQSSILHDLWNLKTENKTEVIDRKR